MQSNLFIKEKAPKNEDAFQLPKQTNWFFASPIGVRANKQKPLVAIRRVDVSPIGFEPMTASLEGRCSIQLSY